MDKIEQIRWTSDGIESFEGVIGHIARDSQYYAGSFAKKILQRIENLVDFPLMGRVVPEYRNESLREILYQNYRIVYKVFGHTVRTEKGSSLRLTFVAEGGTSLK